MKNKKVIICLIIAFVVAAITATVFIVKYIDNSNKLFDGNINDVEKVYITNGNNGNMIELTKSEIEEILSQCKDMKIKNYETEPIVGWSYNVDIFMENKTQSIILNGNTICNRDGEYYKVNEDEGKNLFSIIERLYEAHK